MWIIIKYEIVDFWLKNVIGYLLCLKYLVWSIRVIFLLKVNVFIDFVFENGY